MVRGFRGLRAHAIIEQVDADLKNGPSRTCPRDLRRDQPWLVLAASAFNLTCAAQEATGTRLPEHNPQSA